MSSKKIKDKLSADCVNDSGMNFRDWYHIEKNYKQIAYLPTCHIEIVV